MPKAKMQTTEAGITVTLKYPKDRAKDIISFYDVDVEIDKVKPESIPIGTQEILDQIKVLEQGLQTLRGNIEQVLGGGE